MRSESQDIWKLREAAEGILHQLCPRTFGYTVEAKDAGWTLRVEFATDDGWQTVSLPIDPAELGTSLDDAGVRSRLISAWTRRLAACMARTAGSA